MKDLLKESEGLLRSVIAFCSIGIIVVQDNKIVYQSPEQRNMLVFSDELPFKEGLLKWAYPDDKEKVARFIDRVSRNRDEVQEVEARFASNKKRSGTRFIWYRCRGGWITYRGELALLLTMMEITERKKLEELLISREKLASLGQVVAGVTHEIRNPLSGITVFLDAIKESLTELDHIDGIMELVEEAINAAHKIDRVVRRVLGFARHAAPRMRPGSLNKAIQDAVALAESTLRKSGIELSLHYELNLPDIYLDVQLMEQVVLNLINNAREALLDFDGPKMITISSYAEGDCVGFQVCDTGPGVPPEDQERVFEPFFTRKKGGTGIGLSLCRRIVEDHGGWIRLYRSPDGETVVDVKLPREKRTKSI